MKSSGNLFEVCSPLNYNENCLLRCADLVLNPWETTEDGQRRTLTYTVSINHAIGPKHSPTTEQQVSFDKHIVSQLISSVTISKSLRYQPSR